MISWMRALVPSLRRARRAIGDAKDDAAVALLPQDLSRAFGQVRDNRDLCDQCILPGHAGPPASAA